MIPRDPFDFAPVVVFPRGSNRGFPFTVLRITRDNDQMPDPRVSCVDMAVFRYAQHCCNEVAKRFELRHFPYPISFMHLSITCQPPRNPVIQLQVHALLYDREKHASSYDDGERTRVVFGEGLGVEQLDGRDGVPFLIEWICRFLRFAIEHELDECIWMNGQRLKDPHEKDAAR